MKIPKSIINDVINRVVLAVVSSDISRFELMQELYWAKNVINWHLTDYCSWRKFCDKHVTLSGALICRYTVSAGILLKFKYTDAQAKRMLAGVGWTNFWKGLLNMNNKLSVKGFIKKYKGYTETGDGRCGKYPEGDRVYIYSLPAEIADRLDVYLKAYGMSKGKHHRTGVRTAMIKLIKQKLK